MGHTLSCLTWDPSVTISRQTYSEFHRDRHELQAPAHPFMSYVMHPPMHMLLYKDAFHPSTVIPQQSKHPPEKNVTA